MNRPHIDDKGGLLAWQPIETAPREKFTGVFLVARDHGKRCVLPAIFDGANWRVLGLAGAFAFANPTHWMPLPQPPVASQ